ncbi:hypothetical protein FD16_GL002362 [Paucilactobacillus suebicus DSM 5007 = KCTC 3549]|uniref:Uncharacterized protein n=1 Tax=Paucilactobacillus suebicus DSM 5007 = KCTC 3549 TaxID=1423807 RepID=A0A0R1W4F2_9LACO|nr:hypothetical protein FD16_GL002362 [Paucilactobacillus suebicus DSM 5007 = KCTC 3549]
MGSSISIHALTKSATLIKALQKAGKMISIHALTKSATVRFAISSGNSFYFNSRTHEECDFI